MMPATFGIPVRGAYTLTAHFGKPGSTWSSGYHTGQDFAAPKGTAVVASAGGIVTFSGNSGKYGNRVEITHANGYVTTYSHLNTITAKRFQPITQGGAVGTVGTTGNTTGPHLHFEMKIGGKFVDPMKHIGTTDIPVGETPDDFEGVTNGGGSDITAGSTWLRVAYFLGGLVLLGMGYLAVRKGGLKL